ncbi:TPA: helix-turn-helix transcriptional regulator [Proteus mirabilis]|uniref:helix-turn-helix domain-containing protein n=1 Tax=Gammaproteobacteria TaxID=1236 RepID=UPI00073CE626|nr:helix-turn-helix transcriptional regulator [Proteus mirabilis]NAC33153.1 helix-turn-helix domain-containing protein [Escherichia coli]AZG98385.1 XRE family transcriptional regulator [Proteus mirabilis]KSX93634.1 transcriptional regulator [Proteus mirabilis]MBG2991036.1 helix-turn-helix transcriptional regulator [Proteus mirabilis]MBG6041815.1 helix-turn-helix transcriptional regulator [Proteus mirabilis]
MKTDDNNNVSMSDFFNKKTGLFIKYKRKELGLTGQDLAIILNVSQQQISRYENGTTNITVTLLNNILMILDSSWSEFLTFNELTDRY